MKHFILLKILITSLAIVLFAGFVSSAMPVYDSPNGLLLIEYPVFTTDTTAPGEINNMPGNQPDSSGQENLMQKDKNQPAVSFKDTQFKVYPNPGQGIFHLEVNNKTFMQLDFGVFDLTGKEIWQRTTRCVTGCKIDINLQSFNDGIYLLKIQSGNQQKVLKLLKQ